MQNPYSPPTAELDSIEASPRSTMGPLEYAGFWRRFGAYWIDAAVLLPMSGIAYFFGEKFRLFSLYWFVPSVMVLLWFHVYLVKRFGGMPGKIVLKTRIAMVDGSAITWQAASLRYAILFVLTLGLSIAMITSAWNMSDNEYFSLGYIARSQRLVATAPTWYWPVMVLLQIWVWGEFITMLFNKKRRAVHDFIAGTVVVRR